MISNLPHGETLDYLSLCVLLFRMKVTLLFYTSGTIDFSLLYRRSGVKGDIISADKCRVVHRFVVRVYL